MLACTPLQRSKRQNSRERRAYACRQHVGDRSAEHRHCEPHNVVALQPVQLRQQRHVKRKGGQESNPAERRLTAGDGQRAQLMPLKVDDRCQRDGYTVLGR